MKKNLSVPPQNVVSSILASSSKKTQNSSKNAKSQAVQGEWQPPESWEILASYKMLCGYLGLSAAAQADIARRGLNAELFQGFSLHKGKNFLPSELEISDKFPGVQLGYGNKKYIYSSCAGYTVPCTDLNGFVVGYQIRNVGESGKGFTNGKYLWTTNPNQPLQNRVYSEGLVMGEFPGGYEMPLTFEVDHQDLLGIQTLYLSEGILKPRVARHNLGISLVGAAGGNFNSSRNQLALAIANLTNLEKIVICPDAGAVSNSGTLANIVATHKLLEQIAQQLERELSITFLWYEQEQKGTARGDIDEIAAELFESASELSYSEFSSLSIKTNQGKEQQEIDRLVGIFETEQDKKAKNRRSKQEQIKRHLAGHDSLLLVGTEQDFDNAIADNRSDVFYYPGLYFTLDAEFLCDFENVKNYRSITVIPSYKGNIWENERQANWHSYLSYRLKQYLGLIPCYDPEIIRLIKNRKEMVGKKGKIKKWRPNLNQVDILVNNARGREVRVNFDHLTGLGFIEPFPSNLLLGDTHGGYLPRLKTSLLGQRCIGLIAPKGTGKTTQVRQFIKNQLEKQESIYYKLQSYLGTRKQSSAYATIDWDAVESLELAEKGSHEYYLNLHMVLADLQELGQISLCSLSYFNEIPSSLLSDAFEYYNPNRLQSLILTPLVNLNAQIATSLSDLGFKNLNATERPSTRDVACFDSAHRYIRQLEELEQEMTLCEQYGLPLPKLWVFFEEIMTALPTLVHPNSRAKRNLLGIKRALRLAAKLALKAGGMLLVDADLSYSVLRNIAEWLEIPQEQLGVVRHKSDNPSIKIAVAESGQLKSRYRNTLKEALERGQRVVLSSESKDSLNQIKYELNWLREHRDRLSQDAFHSRVCSDSFRFDLVSQETVENTCFDQFRSNPNKFLEDNQDIDIFGYTPSLRTGYDITYKGFDVLLSYGNGVGSSDEYRQMLSRFRDVDLLRVLFLQPNSCQPVMLNQCNTRQEFIDELTRLRLEAVADYEYYEPINLNQATKAEIALQAELLHQAKFEKYRFKDAVLGKLTLIDCAEVLLSPYSCDWLKGLDDEYQKHQVSGISRARVLESEFEIEALKTKKDKTESEQFTLVKSITAQMFPGIDFSDFNPANIEAKFKESNVFKLMVSPSKRNLTSRVRSSYAAIAFPMMQEKGKKAWERFRKSESYRAGDAIAVRYDYDQAKVLHRLGFGDVVLELLRLSGSQFGNRIRELEQEIKDLDAQELELEILYRQGQSELEGQINRISDLIDLKQEQIDNYTLVIESSQVIDISENPVLLGFNDAYTNHSERNNKALGLKLGKYLSRAERLVKLLKKFGLKVKQYESDSGIADPNKIVLESWFQYELFEQCLRALAIRDVLGAVAGAYRDTESDLFGTEIDISKLEFSPSLMAILGICNPETEPISDENEQENELINIKRLTARYLFLHPSRHFYNVFQRKLTIIKLEIRQNTQ